MVKLSVCITTYNRVASLDRTLKSLAAQTRLPDELIISDDCSPDDPVHVVDKWRDQFPRVRYNRNSRNLNMPGNLNAAMGLTTGEYVANLHDADEFDPSLLAEWEKALDVHPTAGFVFCGVGSNLHHKEFGNNVDLHDVLPFTTGHEFFERYFLHKFSSIVWGTVMARRSVYEELLPFDETFGFVSDVDMWMRMCFDHDVAYVRKPLIILDHSPTEERGSGTFNWKWLDISRKMQEINIRHFYEDQPDIMHTELQHHYWIAQRVYAMRLLGRLKNLDWTGLRDGLRLCRNLHWPLKGLGFFSPNYGRGVGTRD